MKYLILILSLIFLPAQAEISTTAEAINKAGLQRMLGQRIVKSYLMVGSDVKAEKAQQELDQAIALFEQQHLELLDFAPSAKINNALEKVSELWMPFRLKAVSRPDKQTAAELIKTSDALFERSNNVVYLLEKHANSKAAQLVNISGKQRMLSQKIAKLYMAMAWHINQQGIEKSFQQTLNEYQQGLNKLQQAPENTAAINSQLNKINAQWEFSKAGFSQYKEGRYVPTLISVTTESMLKKMDELTGDYQRLTEQTLAAH